MAHKKTNVLLANGVRPFGAETPKGIADQLGGRRHDCRPADVTEIKD